MTNSTGDSSQPPAGVQPGGHGFFVQLELLWAKLRRSWLRLGCPGHVKHWQSLRQGDCQRYGAQVIDSRDLKYIRNVCPIRFPREQDPYLARERMGFARYGFAELLGCSIIAIIALLTVAHFTYWHHWAFGLAIPVVLLGWAFVLWFFRDPERTIPNDPNVVVSPADGTVTHIEEVDDADFPRGRAFRISIFLSVFNVHVNRMPRAGEVVLVQYRRGAYLDARRADCAQRNEQLWLDMRDRATGQKIRIKQIAGAIARRIVCWASVGEKFPTGERFGMIKFGSRTDVLVPVDFFREVRVKVGDKVAGGSTVLALV